MHCSNFPGRIYVEKTPEQCNLNYHHSRRIKADIWYDMYLSEGLDEEQVDGNDEVKGEYINVTGLWEKGDTRKGERKICKRDLSIVSTFKSRTILFGFEFITKVCSYVNWLLLDSQPA